MATFTVWKFAEASRAGRAAKVLSAAESDGLVKIVDRAVLSWPVGAKPPRATSRTTGAPRGRLRRLPGAAGRRAVLHAAARRPRGRLGALHKAMERVGISKEQMETLRWQITEGTSALFLLTDEADLDRLSERFHGTRWLLIDTNLTDVEQARLLGTLDSE